MTYEIDYYKDEVRDGFYIPTAVKQAWASELAVLREIDRICEKYQLSYFADWGTLLGCVRHGGFVPWDDDLDICMKRKDYQKFLQVAKDELPKGFDIYNYKTKENHWLFLARVVNKNRICFEEEHLLKYHNFPYISGVDIFVLDYFYDDEEKEIKRQNEIMHLLAIAEPIIQDEANDQYKLAQKISFGFSSKTSDREFLVYLYGQVEKLLSETPETEASRIGQIYPFGLKGFRGFSKRLYDDCVKLPFENGTIRVTPGYNKALRNKYHDYFEIHKVWCGHDYPFFEAQKLAFEKVGGRLREYKFDSLSLSRTDNEEETIREIISRIIDECKELMNSCYENLGVIQEKLILLGNTIEESYGENSDEARPIIEKFEKFFAIEYEFFNDRTKEREMSLHEAFAELKEMLEKFLDVSEAYFLTNGVGEWEDLKPLYDACEGMRRYVVYVPYFFKDPIGNLIINDEDVERALDTKGFSVPVLNMTMADIRRRAPKIIYLQCPYDSYNASIGTPEEFHAVNLRKICEKLIYVPLRSRGFLEGDVIENKLMKYYVGMPGVTLADEIILSSYELKDRYVAYLLEFTGLSYEDKIQVFDHHPAENVSKKLLYCIGIDRVSDFEDPEKFLISTKGRFELIGSMIDREQYDVMLYPDDEKTWEMLYPGVWNELRNIVKDKFLPYDMKVSDAYKAYYGAASPIVRNFASMKKPVMIEDGVFE